MHKAKLEGANRYLRCKSFQMYYVPNFNRSKTRRLLKTRNIIKKLNNFFFFEKNLSISIKINVTSLLSKKENKITFQLLSKSPF